MDKKQPLSTFASFRGFQFQWLLWRAYCHSVDVSTIVLSAADTIRRGDVYDAHILHFMLTSVYYVRECKGTDSTKYLQRLDFNERQILSSSPTLCLGLLGAERREFEGI
jgi:anthranilate/para-aminobenzoate synthase component I